MNNKLSDQGGETKEREKGTNKSTPCEDRETGKKKKKNKKHAMCKAKCWWKNSGARASSVVCLRKEKTMPTRHKNERPRVYPPPRTPTCPISSPAPTPSASRTPASAPCFPCQRLRDRRWSLVVDFSPNTMWRSVLSTRLCATVGVDVRVTKGACARIPTSPKTTAP